MPRHVVRPGDNVKSIIKKYKADLENLVLANSHIRDFERLTPGEVINIPGYTDGSLIHLEPRPLKPQLLTMLGISDRQISEHTKLYHDYINKINQIRTKLQSVNRSDVNSTHSDFRSLKIAETHAVVGYNIDWSVVNSRWMNVKTADSVV
ncbi:Peptidoglycan-binding lysin domain protein [Desulfotomaculum nigrificans CO-1-SRB]|uniref:Peptidoglycan-binding lysin domain protein n=1 Tax=Desulfotomaculum nigrificans (strain DSM 14880 / VKM B-2319 / CO-1-SRB) TaxID=868595 RepID=F6B404_DESCC|nr:LysM domain-containing protein [Desulfotomaculum nigrificans]AEF94059.1 Peptidoglycan-binding lysin domain protein [Desulfotomaculum nigrificans CO-1-SRB]